MSEAEGIKQKIANSATTEAIIRTTGDGRPEEIVGSPRTDADETSTALDILTGALLAAGPKLAIGTFRDAVLTFDGGVLVLACDEERAAVGVLAQSGASAGLLLNQVRRMLDPDRARRGGGTR